MSICGVGVKVPVRPVYDSERSGHPTPPRCLGCVRDMLLHLYGTRHLIREDKINHIIIWTLILLYFIVIFLIPKILSNDHGEQIRIGRFHF